MTGEPQKRSSLAGAQLSPENESSCAAEPGDVRVKAGTMQGWGARRVRGDGSAFHLAVTDLHARHLRAQPWRSRWTLHIDSRRLYRRICRLIKAFPYHAWASRGTVFRSDEGTVDFERPLSSFRRAFVPNSQAAATELNATWFSSVTQPKARCWCKPPKWWRGTNLLSTFEDPDLKTPVLNRALACTISGQGL